MHSSGIRTAHLLTISYHALWPGEVYLPGGGECTCPGEVYMPGGCTCLGGVPASGCTYPGGYLPRGCTCPGGEYLPRGVVPAWGSEPAQGGVPAQGMYLPAGTCLGDVPAQGGPAQVLPPVSRMTDRQV